MIQQLEVAPDGAPLVSHMLSGLGLSPSQLRSILNRGGLFSRTVLPDPVRRVLQCRWQAHSETLRRGIDRIAEAIGSQGSMSVWPLGNAYWFGVLQTEHESYCVLRDQIASELTTLE